MMSTCVHCARRIVFIGGYWVDPEARGDDAMWGETCDANDTFTAEHEPATRTSIYDDTRWQENLTVEHGFELDGGSPRWG